MTDETSGSDLSHLTAPRAARWWRAAVFAASVAVFSGTLASPFLLDDVWLIQKKPVVQEGGRAFEAFTTDYWGMRRDKKNRHRHYRPLTVISLAANRALGGNAPGGYRAVNIFLHAAAGLLLFWMAGRFGLSIAQAGATALLFALHPLHTEAVNAVVGRADLLAAIAAFAGMGFMLGGALPGANPPGGGRKRGSPGEKTGAPKAANFGDKKAAGVGAIFLLGLLSKEIGAAILIWAALWWSWSRLAYPREESGGPEAGRAFAAMGIALALYLALRYQALGVWVKPTPAILLDNPLAYAGAGERMFGALGVLGRYLKLLVWPWPLAIDYSYGQVLAGGGETALFAAAGGAGLALWGWSAWRWRGDFPGVGFGLTLFLAGWFPVSNFAAPIGTVMAERLMYLPSAGFVIAFAPPLARVLGRRGEGAFIGALASVSLLFGGMIWARNRDWADPPEVLEKGDRGILQERPGPP